MEMLDSTACVVTLVVYVTLTTACQINCPEDTDSERLVCAFDKTLRTYKVFASTCALKGYNDCNDKAFTETPVEFCIKHHFKSRRNNYYDSCPMFCPEHYRPVCGASQYRDYKYRAFNNGCYLDMVNCRGEEDDGYIQVPLSYCPRHPMKNMFKERVIAMNFGINEDY